MYSREIDGQVLTLAASGWLYGGSKNTSIFVLYDYETWSIWLPVEVGDGVCEGVSCGCAGVLWCISGHYFGRYLQALPTSFVTQWYLWHLAHPDTRFLVDP